MLIFFSKQFQQCSRTRLVILTMVTSPMLPRAATFTLDTSLQTSPPTSRLLHNISVSLKKLCSRLVFHHRGRYKTLKCLVCTVFMYLQHTLMSMLFIFIHCFILQFPMWTAWSWFLFHQLLCTTLKYSKTHVIWNNWDSSQHKLWEFMNFKSFPQCLPPPGTLFISHSCSTVNCVSTYTPSLYVCVFKVFKEITKCKFMFKQFN